MTPHLGLHVHEVQPFGVDADVDADDFVVAGAGLRIHLAGEKSGAVGGDVPAVLQEEPLQVMHLLAHAFAGAQRLFFQIHSRKFETVTGGETCPNFSEVPLYFVFVKNPVGPVVGFAFHF